LTNPIVASFEYEKVIDLGFWKMPCIVILLCWVWLWIYQILESPIMKQKQVLTFKKCREGRGSKFLKK
jgi:hypothetical protein